ncbi:MAG: helix-turn-helix domain-containing protein [Alphaproteobacteria bacterium]|nr:helix-turn-helix domain-containing protein [Alphaproteobacteria bacterium]
MSDYYNSIDVHIGARLKLCRTTANLTQEQLSEQVGLTFQQIQKYEHGLNRISASRLYEFSQIFRVPISFFFEGIDNSNEHLTEISYFTDNPETQKETLELINAFFSIDDRNVAKSLLDLAKTLSKN